MPETRSYRPTSLQTAVGGVTAPANRHDSSPLLVPTLDHASESVGAVPDGASVYLDRGYDSELSPASV